MPKVVFVLTPGIHLLDLAGPAQVFSMLGDVAEKWELHYVADTKMVRSFQGVELSATLTWPKLATVDLAVIPGWRANRLAEGVSFSDALLNNIAIHHADGGTVMSVCAGAEALGRAGLLHQRKCTTHHELQDELAARYPTASVIKDVLFVDDDRVLSSAGIASGIDLALHVVATRYGPAVAARVARQMVVFARRNGEDPQHSVMLSHRLHLDDLVHRTQDHIDESFTDSVSLLDLAARLGVSERTLTRAFTNAIGLTPLKYQQALRVERAEQLIGSGRTVEAAAHEVGFVDARMLRRLRSRAS
jgi:transcriptional regulator GlxA family with amidase domain